MAGWRRAAAGAAAAGAAAAAGWWLLRRAAAAAKEEKEEEEGGGEGDLFLGVDMGTQSLKAVLLDAAGRPAAEASVAYDEELPRFGTRGGVLRGPGELEVAVPAAMLAAALDEALDRLPRAALRRARAVSCSAQQHGAVLWSREAPRALAALGRPGAGAVPLERALAPALASPLASSWMDSSTARECRAIEAHAGGAQRVADLSGSRAYERFTAAQLAAVMRRRPEVWEAARHVSLLSAFGASLLAGALAPADASDAGGTNLCDVRAGEPLGWHHALLRACCAAGGAGAGDLDRAAEALRARLAGGGEPLESGGLGEGGADGVVPSHAVVGHVARHFQERHGLPADCAVVAGSGDNPCSLVGLRLDRPGDAAVSLGTSDTLFAVTDGAARPSAAGGHVLRSPLDPRAHVAMLCYKNGSVTRERVRDAAGLASWREFEEALARAPPGNGRRVACYFLEPEIVPTVNRANVVRRFGPSGRPWAAFDAAHEARALVEGRFFSMRRRARALGLGQPRRVLATGGAAANRGILQALADVFEAPVYTLEGAAATGAAAAGAAVRAAHGLRCLGAGGRLVPLDELGLDRGWRLACEPRPEHYAELRATAERYEQCEARVVREVAAAAAAADK